MNDADCAAGAEVAVCIAGQLRSLERPHLQRVMRATWGRVGRGCVDLFMDIGIDGYRATNNHGPGFAKSIENASAAVETLRPLEWRVSSVPMPNPRAAPGLDCVRESGAAAATDPVRRLCVKGPSVEGVSDAGTSCEARNCTHCAVTNYYANAERIAACAATARAAGERLGRRYRYFAYHRPDLQLYGIPPYREWDFGKAPLADEGLNRSALFCAPRPQYAIPSDFFGIVGFAHIDAVAGMAAFTKGCHSKARHVELGCQADGWPSWHSSECLVRASFARRGVSVRSLTDLAWPKMLKACRIVRERGTWGMWNSKPGRTRPRRGVA